MPIALLVALGGGIGAVLRHYMNTGLMAVTGASFPLGVMTINILGSFIMGLLIAVFANVWEPSQELRAFLTVGILGGFTTFSSFSLDAVMLWQRGEAVQAVGYVVGSVVLSILALAGAMLLVRAVSP